MPILTRFTIALLVLLHASRVTAQASDDFGRRSGHPYLLYTAVKGKRNTIEGCNLQQRAFGHGIYLQSPADETDIKNCLVEGAMRPSKDLYLDTNLRPTVIAGDGSTIRNETEYPVVLQSSASGNTVAIFEPFPIGRTECCHCESCRDRSDHLELLSAPRLGEFLLPQSGQLKTR